MDMTALNRIYYGSPAVSAAPGKKGLDARVALVFDVVRDHLEASLTAQRLVETGVLEKAPSRASKIFNVVVSAAGVMGPVLHVAHLFNLAPALLGEAFHFASEAAELGGDVAELKEPPHRVSLRLDQIRAIATEMGMRCAMHYAPDVLHLPYHRVAELADLVGRRFLDELSSVDQKQLGQKGLGGLYQEVIGRIDPPAREGLAHRISALLEVYADHPLVRHIHLIGRLWFRGERRSHFQLLAQNLVLQNKGERRLSDLYPGIEGKAFDPVKVNVRAGALSLLSAGCFAITDKLLVPSVVDCLRIVQTEAERHAFWTTDQKAQQVFNQLHAYNIGKGEAPRIERWTVERAPQPRKKRVLYQKNQLPNSFFLKGCIKKLIERLPLCDLSRVNESLFQGLSWTYWNRKAITSYLRTAHMAEQNNLSWRQIRGFANS